MALVHVGYVDLPPHAKPGGFDHAAVHGERGELYVAHTANDAVDVIDCRTHTYLRSIPDLTGVAGALISEAHALVFTSNRGEDTVGIFSASGQETVAKVRVGVGPNGLAYAAGQRLLLAANVGDPARRGSFSVTLVDVSTRAVIANIPVPGRTRWAVFDEESGRFYVNIADPPRIVVVDSADPTRLADTFPMPAMGPHGLDLDAATRRLFCACDGKVLLVVDSRSGAVTSEHPISGVPDVVFRNAALRHLYVAIGDPGVIDVFDTETMRRLVSVPTERGAHTIGFDAIRNTVYAFLPDTHRAAVYRGTRG
jgi:DNA-binding beta-propeller fold protein YncE